MINVVFIGTETEEKIIDKHYKVSYFNPFQYLDSINFGYIDKLDSLWRSGNTQYEKLLNDFYTKYKGVDIIVANWINPFHPEWLIRMFPDTIKVYGCIDDPVSTYIRTAASLYAFDGAFYVSPGYDENYLMSEVLEAMGKPSFFWPLSSGCVDDAHIRKVKNSWNQRTKNVIYIGKYYGQKMDRLCDFKEALKGSFDIYGNWVLHGFAGMLAGPLKLLGIGSLKKFRFFPYRIKALSESQREMMYLNHKICLNMHLNNRRETGNMRMYESVYYGNMLLCDKAAKDTHEIIYTPDKEAVFYDDIGDAIEKARYYLSHDNERERIAKAGFERYCNDYDPDKTMQKFLDWCCNLRAAKQI